MKAEENGKLQALKSLLTWLENGGIDIAGEPYFGMCAWVRIYLDDHSMNDDVTEAYLISLGLSRPINDYCHWFPTSQSHQRISLVKEAIKALES